MSSSQPPLMRSAARAAVRRDRRLAAFHAAITMNGDVSSAR